MVAPLLLYLYLPLRAAAHPSVTVGGEVSNWEGFVTHVLGSQYRKFVFARPLEEAVALGGRVGYEFGAALTLVGALLVVVGLISLFRRARALAGVMVGATALLTVWNLGYDVGDVVDFFVPAWLGLGLWVGEGLAVMRRALARVATKSLVWAPAAVGGAALLLIPGNLVQREWSKCDRSSC